jgi:IPT/TIG domain
VIRALRATALLAASLLAACGGGGGGGGSGGTPPPAPLSLSISPTSLSFAATSSAAPAAQTVTATLTGTGSGTLYVLITPADPSLLTVGNITIGTTSGQGTVTPADPAKVGVGSHSTTISVAACLNDPTCKTGQIQGSPKTINVTYTVAGVTASVPSLDYTIGNAPVAADYVRSFTVSGFPSQTWASASTAAPYVSFTPSTGSTAAPVTVQANLDPSSVAGLLNGKYIWNLTITPASGLPVVVPVNLTVARTQVTYVAPYVGTSGVTDNVIISGENFSKIDPASLSVNIGTTTATGVTVVSDNEIQASYPALTAGKYPVQVLSAGSAVGTSRANLVIVDPPAYAAAKIPYPAGAPTGTVNLVYDAERQRLYMLNTYAAAPQYMLQQVGYYSTLPGWDAPVSVAAAPSSAIALGADGSSIVSGYYDSTDMNLAVAQFDPTNLSQTGAVGHAALSSQLGAAGIIVTSNGDVYVPTNPVTGSNMPYLFRYKPLTGAVDAPYGFSVNEISGKAAASADGATLVLTFRDPSSGLLSVDTYDPVLPRLSQGLVPVTSTASVSVDRHGSRVLLTGEVFKVPPPDMSITQFLGKIADSTVASILAPDATRAYAYDTNGTVRVFDLTQPTGAGGHFPEVTPAKVLSGSPSASAWATLAISPDGGSLFVAIDSGIYVVPLP